MWLFTTLGFFSAVQKPGDDYLTVRARVAGDLDRLRAKHLPELSPTIHGAGTDYPYRATISHEAFGRGMVGMMEDLRYSNFKDAIAATQGYKRAKVYGKVWESLLSLEEPHSTSGTPPVKPLTLSRAYGGVVIDDRGRVLLHEPRDHFGGYHWTFPKGRPHSGEEPSATALREVREETGIGVTFRGAVPGSFAGTTTDNEYFLLSPSGEAGQWDNETSTIRWATRDEAAQLIALTTTPVGRERDLRVLDAAFTLHESLIPGDFEPVSKGREKSSRFHVIGNGNALVEGWSTARLPFMPTDWRKDFRQRLRDELRHLVASPDQILHATLISPDTRTFDAENILLYNVDLGRLAAASRYGLRFERALTVPPACPMSLRAIPEYYHRYALVPVDSSFHHWTPGRVLVRWNGTLPTPAAIKRWQYIWYALKRGEIAVVDSTVSLANGYGLRVTLRTRTPGTPRVIDLIKPLFDGVVTALHHHDGTAEPEICARLSALLAVDAEEIAQLLHDERGAVLGLRRLIFMFGTGMMANPQDDLCFAGQLLLEAVEPTAPTELLVEVFAITPRGSHEEAVMEECV